MSLLNSQVMNFINDLAKLRIIFFITAISLTSDNIFSSDIIPYSNLNTCYLGSFANNSAPFYDFTFNEEGLIYLSSHNYIIISNGINEQIVSVDGTIKLSAGTKHIFALGKSEAGYIQSESSGNFTFQSFRTLFDSLSHPFNPINALETIEDDVYISSFKKSVYV